MQIERRFSQCGDYQIIKKLGSGFHAKVKLGEKDGRRVAIKIFKKNHDTLHNITTLANEINALQRLTHPNIVKFIEFNQSLPYTKRNGKVDLRACIILEFVQGGELYDYVSITGQFSQEVSRFYFKQLLTAMIYMSNKGVCHRDLKLENILLDEVFNLKVTDFGFAKVMEAGNLRTNLGTPGYIAPEIIAKREYNGTKVDIFSAGVILFILHAGLPPFNKASQDDQHYNFFLTNDLERFWKIHSLHKRDPNYFPPDFRNLINGMLDPNPENRFTLDQCMQHSWTNGNTASIQQIQNQFNERLIKVRVELEAQQNRQLAQRNRNRQYNVGNFRDSGLENKEEDFQEIIQKYQLNFEQKQLTIGQNTGVANEIILYEDPKFVFCYLLKICQNFQLSVTKIHDKKYKIYFQVNEEESENQENQNQENQNREKIQFYVEILDYQQEQINLSVNKISGDYFKFKQIYFQIQEAIISRYCEQPQEEIQQN